MSRNVGNIDRIVRIVLGLLLLAYALGLVLPNTGWNWLGWIGLILLLTATAGYCPAYGLLGVRTCK